MFLFIISFFQQTSESLQQQRINGTYSATIALSCEGAYRASGTLYLPGDDAALLPERVVVTAEINSVVISSNLSKEFCDYYTEHNYTSTLVQVKVFGIREEVINITSVLTPTGGEPVTTDVLDIDQTINPPQLLIAGGFEMDWCQYERAELTWTISGV